LIKDKVEEIYNIERNLKQLSQREAINRNVYEALIDIVGEASRLSISKTTPARIISPADVPSEPVKPQRILLSFTAFIFSLIGGIFLADYRESKVYLSGGEQECVEAEEKAPMITVS
jgi:uncharacterized protein involved in exopolysaccharide biosynthesis